MPSMSNAAENFVTLFVLVGFFIIILSRVNKENISETLKRIKSWFGGDEDGRG